MWDKSRTMMSLVPISLRLSGTSCCDNSAQRFPSWERSDGGFCYTYVVLPFALYQDDWSSFVRLRTSKIWCTTAQPARRHSDRISIIRMKTPVKYARTKRKYVRHYDSFFGCEIRSIVITTKHGPICAIIRFLFALSLFEMSSCCWRYKLTCFHTTIFIWQFLEYIPIHKSCSICIYIKTGIFPCVHHAVWCGNLNLECCSWGNLSAARIRLSTYFASNRSSSHTTCAWYYGKDRF